MSTNIQADARAACAFYEKIHGSLSERGGVSALSFDELNALYNIAIKAQKDEDFARALALCDTEKAPLAERIGILLSDYSVHHGVDIREELYEITKAEGTVYFKAETDREAHAYRLGDSITFHVTVRDKESGRIASCDKLEYTYEIEGVPDAFSGIADGGSGTLTITVPSEAILASSFVKNGVSGGIMVRLAVSAVGVEEQEKFLGGAVVDMDKIAIATEKPQDFDEFWQKNLDACFSVSPIDTVPMPYDKTGVVVSDMRRYGDEFSREHGRLISEENYFHAAKIDAEKLAVYHKKGKNTNITEAILGEYDFYEVYLKSPGPCPSSLLLSIPKAAQGSAKAFLGFPGYSAHAPNIYAAPNVIGLMVTHHGYWVDASDEELYDEMNKGENAILHSYGRANGRPNSGYDDPYDCYMLYLLLRDFQAIRFAYELPRGVLGTQLDGVLGEIYSSLLRAWDGRLELSGWSMGGYQTLCLGGLAAKAGIPLSFIRAAVPGFCNLAGHAVGGRLNNIFGIKYDPDMLYFDPVAHAEYIDSYVEITRCSLGDYTCPPSGIIAAYNAMRCKKKICLYQNSTHGYVPADTDIFTREDAPRGV